MSNRKHNRYGYKFSSVPSFITGAASAFDLFGTLAVYNISDSPDEADFNAIASDFYETAYDIRDAVNQYYMGLDNEQKKSVAFAK